MKKYYSLLLLALMFAAPGIAAYFFYQHPSWLGTSKINKGHLLYPPVQLGSLGGNNKWRIVFWSPNHCDKACLIQLNLLARIRLALGRKLYYVDQWLVLGEKAAPLTKEIETLLADQEFHVVHLSHLSADLPKHPQVFLANPDKYLILSYSSKANPDDIYKDLKLLLNTAENKSGM